MKLSLVMWSSDVLPHEDQFIVLLRLGYHKVSMVSAPVNAQDLVNNFKTTVFQRFYRLLAAQEMP